ncbi:MAG: hypothetical protein ACT6SF_06335 [Hydrogenophaga sp.]|uniref:hypothetical protein n=1 Tax=Hydrogenophaga sp. TaxID=1904254 RepID=UPI0040373FDD
MLNEQGKDKAQERQVDIAVANNLDQPVTPLPLAYGRVEIDEHLLHASAEVTFQSQSGVEVHVEVRRLYALALRECRFGAILATTLSYGARYDVNDVLRLVRKALFPPKRFNLTIDSPEFRYHEGAAYPAELPTFAANCWQLLAFDADSTHISVAQQELLRRVLRCKIAGERIGSPTARHSIEGVFGGLAQHFEVLSSGSGSHPRSPARRDPEGAAREFGIKAEHLEEMLDVWARNRNVAFSRALGASPLEALEQLTLKGEVFINKLGELAGHDKKHEFYPRFESTLRLSRGKTGALLVNLYGAKYSGPELASNKLLLSTSDLSCTLYVNDEDARFGYVIPRAYPDMRLPVVVQNRALRQFKHTLEARRLTYAANFNLGVADKAVKPDSIRGALDYYGRQAQNNEPGASVAVSRLVGAQAQETLGSASTLDMGVEWSEVMEPVLDPDEAESAESGEGVAPARGHAPKKRGRKPKAQPGSVDSSMYSPPTESGPSIDPLGLGF